MERTFITNYAAAVNNIRKDLETYIVEHDIKALVLGVSGGIDSALCAALAKPVCDKLGIKLIGRFISISSNKPEEYSRAVAIGKYFCTEFEAVDLTNAYDTIKPDISEEDDGTVQFKIRQGNIKARLRMIYLYHLASANKGLVMSTDNFTEYLLGFWTIFGDQGDYCPIQYLWKTEVYEMTEHLATYEMTRHSQDGSYALIACVNCNATDGLGITSTDLDQILPDWRDRYKTTKDGYKEVDEIFQKYVDGDKSFEDHIVIQRMHKTEFKRNHPVVITRNQVL